MSFQQIVEGIRGMDRLFDAVFVRPPAESYANCVSTNPAGKAIDVHLARQQHREYVSVLKESGLRVVEFPALEGFPDSVFVQDPALLGSRLTVFGRFGENTRRGEEKALLDDLNNHRVDVGQVRFVNQPGTLEGGDVLVTDHGIFVGDSRRTNTSGIEQLTEHFAEFEVRAVKTSLLHLLCGCSYISKKTLIIAPDLVDPEYFPRFHFVRIPREEGYAADALYLGEGEVLIPSGFPATVTRLREANYKPIEVELSEFYKGDGGVTCLCSPVYKLF